MLLEPLARMALQLERQQAPWGRWEHLQPQREQSARKEPPLETPQAPRAR
jgi:hypothetical protein